ncbi:MAG: hypothetical protein Q8P72_06400 [Candidatus Roizmanbacteria bacterium]|nr:hypothetical protein [Candidatus Roizmanbacteria bacterium]
MLVARPEGYKGKQYENGFSEFFIAGSFYGILSFEDGTTEEAGKKSLESFKEGLLSADIQNLSSFEHTISDLILKLNFPAHVGLAVGMLFQEALYVKTVGDGQIYFRRAATFDTLLSGDKMASGYLKQYDMAIFTTTKIQDLIGKTEDIQAFVEVAKPADILQKLHDQEYGDEDQGFTALFVEFGQAEDPTSIVPTQIAPEIPIGTSSESTFGKQPPVIVQVPGANMPISFPTVSSAVQPLQGDALSESVFSKLLGFIRTKQFTIIVAVVILALLTWSVVFGYQRREVAKIKARIQEINLDVDKKLSQAEEESFLNMDQSLILISDAKTQVSQLKKDLGNSYVDEVSQLESKIQNSESKIVKKESKDFDEFYDLTLENKDAKGTIIAKENELVAILDADQKSIYVLNVDSKALTQYTHKEVASATAIGFYNDDVFFITKENGIYKFTSQSKVNTIVKDADVKNVVDMELYNGNIYVLDEGDDEVYKFLVTEGGYSDKRPYFGTGQTIDLSGATSIAIDSAIYISKKDSLQKYLSGVRESFSPEFPTKNVEFDQVFTDKNTEQLFVLDTKNASVYILSKEGEYQRQIQSSIFAKASAFFVYNDSIYILSQEKIYTVSLE